VTAPILSRQLAKSIVDALKRAGHLVLAGGEGEAVLRDLQIHIDPVLAKILPRIGRSPIMGEVTSTFGDEATDEAVEELVAELREALLDSDGVEDVYADDRTIERMIFRCLLDDLRNVGDVLDDAEDSAPPISVRLDTLGYVAAHAARSADDDTLRDALDRAAEAVKSELDRYEPGSRTAFFRPANPDPEQRIDIESSIEEELSDLVDLGVVDLPTVTRRVGLARELDRAEQKALFRTIDKLAQKHLSNALSPGSWSWDGPGALSLTFTPLAEPDERVIDEQTQAFSAELATLDLSAPEFSVPTPQAASPDAGALALAQAIAGLKPAKPKDGAAKEKAPKEKAPAKKAAADKSGPASEKPEKPAKAEKAATKPAAKKAATAKTAAKKKAR
jgi:hypothetical protein